MMKTDEGLVVNNNLNEGDDEEDEQGEILMCGIEGEVTDMFSKSLSKERYNRDRDEFWIWWFVCVIGIRRSC